MPADTSRRSPASRGGYGYRGYKKDVGVIETVVHFLADNEARYTQARECDPKPD